MKFVQTVLLSAVAMALVRGQTATQVDLRTQAKSVDFSSALATKPLKSGSILPATCSVGDLYYKTDAPAGGNVYGCVALNTWALQSGGVLGGDVSGTANAATVTQIQGRAIAATAPSGGQALTWNGSTSRWEPQTVSGGSGNATQLQGRNVANSTPSDTNVLCWSTTNSWWGPCTSGGVTNPFTFPGKFTAAASAVGAASFGIPAGVTPSTPAAGDVWNVAGALQFHNGTAAKTFAFLDSSITGTAAGITGKTAQGNGSLLLLGSGSYTAGNVTSIDANGNIVDGGLAVANIVRTGSTYADPGWITSLAAAKVGNGTAQWNANQINGTSLAGLGTGLLKNTTGTGVPSIAGAADLPSHAARHQNGGNDEIGAATPAANAIPKAGGAGTLAAGWLPAPATSALGGVRSIDCSAGGQFVQKINTDGTETCATPAGGGNVSGPGSSTAGNLPQWNGTTGTSLAAGLAVSATPSANAVVEAGPGATIAAGWIPDLSGTYQATAGKNAANGYAGLDAGSRIAKAQAPAATVYTEGSYADPGWITSLGPSKVGNATAQWNANQINGATLAGLATGLLKITTTTGAPTTLPIVTSVGTPGADTNIATEKAVRDAISATGGAGVTITSPNSSITVGGTAGSPTLDISTAYTNGLYLQLAPPASATQTMQAGSIVEFNPSATKAGIRIVPGTIPTAPTAAGQCAVNAAGQLMCWDGVYWKTYVSFDVAQANANAPTVADNCVFAGASSGAALFPACRSLVIGDLPTAVVAQKFFGTSAPGTVAGNLPGDLYSDTTNHNEYWCNAASGTAAPACTSVSSGGWTLLNGSAPSVTNHAVYVGSGTTTPTAVGPDASTTKALFSAGSSADPAFRAIANGDLPTAIKTRVASITNLAPVVGDSGLILVINPATAIHLTRVFCAIQGSTNVVLNLDKRAEATIASDSGAHLLGSDLTAISGGANTTTFANGSSQCGGTSSCAIAAHTPVVMTFTSVSGTPAALNCSVDYTVD